MVQAGSDALRVSQLNVSSQYTAYLFRIPSLTFSVGRQIIQGVDALTIQDRSTQSIPLYNLANCMLAGCNPAAHINLLRETLLRHPAPHPYRTDSVIDFATALVTEFSETSQLQDLDEAISSRDTLTPDIEARTQSHLHVRALSSDTRNINLLNFRASTPLEVMTQSQPIVSNHPSRVFPTPL
jgi:hypothetical protein